MKIIPVRLSPREQQILLIQLARLPRARKTPGRLARAARCLWRRVRKVGE